MSEQGKAEGYCSWRKRSDAVWEILVRGNYVLDVPTEVQAERVVFAISQGVLHGEAMAQERMRRAIGV